MTDHDRLRDAAAINLGLTAVFGFADEVFSSIVAAPATDLDFATDKVAALPSRRLAPDQ